MESLMQKHQQQWMRITKFYGHLFFQSIKLSSQDYGSNTCYIPIALLQYEIKQLYCMSSFFYLSTFLVEIQDVESLPITVDNIKFKASTATMVGDAHYQVDNTVALTKSIYGDNDDVANMRQ